MSTVTFRSRRSASKRQSGLSRADVDPGEGLVEQQDIRLLRKRAGQKHALLLSARQLPYGPLGQIGHAQSLHAGADHLPCRRPKAWLANSRVRSVPWRPHPAP